MPQLPVSWDLLVKLLYSQIGNYPMVFWEHLVKKPGLLKRTLDHNFLLSLWGSSTVISKSRAKKCLSCLWLWPKSHWRTPIGWTGSWQRLICPELTPKQPLFSLLKPKFKIILLHKERSNIYRKKRTGTELSFPSKRLGLTPSSTHLKMWPYWLGQPLLFDSGVKRTETTLP